MRGSRSWTTRLWSGVGDLLGLGPMDLYVKSVEPRRGAE